MRLIEGPRVAIGRRQHQRLDGVVLTDSDDQATRTTLWLFIAYGVLAVPALIGFAWVTIAIARGRLEARCAPCWGRAAATG